MDVYALYGELVYSLRSDVSLRLFREAEEIVGHGVFGDIDREIPCAQPGIKGIVVEVAEIAFCAGIRRIAIDYAVLRYLNLLVGECRAENV